MTSPELDLYEERPAPGSVSFRGLLPEAARAFLGAMERRYACKRFDGRPLEPDFEDYLLEIGRLSPSSFGLEPWRFIAVRGGAESNRALREALAKAAFDQEAVSSAGLILAVLVHRSDDYRPDSAFVRSRSGRFPGGHPVFAADYLGYHEYLVKNGLVEHWARAQAYIPLANMMTGAAAVGIDSCAIEGFDPGLVLSALGEDPGTWAVGILGVFGRRAEAVRPKIREPLGKLAEYR